MKEEQNNNSKKSSVPEEEIQKTSSGWKKFFKKKWFFPAVYLASAALILALITWYQNPDDFTMDSDELGYESVEFESTIEEDVEQGFEDPSNEEARPVTSEVETMVWPTAKDVETQVVLGFFDDEATDEENMEAMVEYNRSFTPSQGISLSHQDPEQSFDVVAALSGTVVDTDKDPLVGHYVQIEHDDGLVTVYQSLEDVQVSKGDEVKQGDVIGRAGRNVFQKDLGIHVHFEVRKDGVAVNPDQYLSQEETESVQ
jgi:stage II sporulation protein Q